MSYLQQECRLDRIRDGVYEIEAGRAWWAVGALHGGYVLALAITAVEQELASDGMSLHHLTLQYLRPFLDGPLRIEVDVQRRGRRMANAALRLHSGGKLAGVALASVAERRTDGDVELASFPQVEPYDLADSRDYSPSRVPIHDKVWTQPRIAEGAGPAPWRVGGWVAPRAAEPIDHRWLAVIVDLWMPTVYRTWGRPRTSSTVDLTYHARAALPDAELPPGSPLLVVLANRVSAGGFVDEDIEVWSPDGSLLAQSRQARFVADLPEKGAKS